MEDAMTRKMNRTLQALFALLSALPFAAVALAQGVNEYGEEPEQQTDINQTVARVSFLEGTASYARGDEPDDWQQADVNVPMTLGDRIYTGGRSRVELQVHGGDSIWVGSKTDLAALNLTEDTKQFALKVGVASFRVPRLDDNDVWEVDTPNSAITFESPGDYRLQVDPDGNTRVTVERGNLTVSAGGGQIGMDAGEEMVIDGIDSPRYDFVSRSSADAWDRWVDGRYGRIQHSASYHYVSNGIVGAEDLDTYGSWSQVPQYGMVWSPSRVAVGWTPYQQGHWVWQDPWGWTWISSEPWGWAPYHYGRWVNYSSRWCWVPVAPAVQRVAYAPALVAFVGSGPGFSASVTIGGGGGYVGWFPLAPHEAFVPWWSRRPDVNVVNVTNVTYVNKTYVTVVNQNTFVSGGAVARNVVTDRAVVRQVETTQVVHGAMPVLPTVASTRVSVRTETAVARPPAAVVARSVVARVAPPPAPPRFQQKLAVIQESKRPVDAASAARLTAQAQAQPRAAVAVRPAANAGGNVTLAPRQGASAATATRSRPAPAPMAAAPVRGRAVATTQQPVSSEPVTARKTGERPQKPNQPASPPSQPEARPAAQVEREPAPAPAAQPNTQAQPQRPQPEARPNPQAEREKQQVESRPTARPAVERPSQEREVAPAPARPAPQAQRAPVPPQPDEKARPAQEERSNGADQAQARKRQQDTRPHSDAYGEHTRPTPKALPAPVRSRPEAQESKRSQPQSADRPDNGKQPQQPSNSNHSNEKSRPKPKPTPKKDNKPDDKG